MYNHDQQKFLDTFYNGVTDPEAKLSLLHKKTGGPCNFHAVTAKENTIEGTVVLITQQIASFEFEILESEGLIKPDYH
jgi:hypothetical protein